jgi:hypothetical protein
LKQFPCLSFPGHVIAGFDATYPDISRVLPRLVFSRPAALVVSPFYFHSSCSWPIIPSSQASPSRPSQTTPSSTSRPSCSTSSSSPNSTSPCPCVCPSRTIPTSPRRNRWRRPPRRHSQPGGNSRRALLHKGGIRSPTPIQ